MSCEENALRGWLRKTFLDLGINEEQSQQMVIALFVAYRSNPIAATQMAQNDQSINAQLLDQILTGDGTPLFRHANTKNASKRIAGYAAIYSILRDQSYFTREQWRRVADDPANDGQVRIRARLHMMQATAAQSAAPSESSQTTDSSQAWAKDAVNNALDGWLDNAGANFRGMFSHPSEAKKCLGQLLIDMDADPLYLMTGAEVIRAAGNSASARRIAGGADESFAKSQHISAAPPGSHAALFHGQVAMIAQGDYNHRMALYANEWLRKQHRPVAATTGYGADLRSQIDIACNNINAGIDRCKNELREIRTNATQMITSANTGQPHDRMRLARSHNVFTQEQTDLANQRAAIALAQINAPQALAAPDLGQHAAESDAKSWYDLLHLLDPSIMPGSQPTIGYLPSASNESAYYEKVSNTIALQHHGNATQMPHEVMHWIESNNSAIDKVNKQFFLQRTKGNPRMPIGQRLPHVDVPASAASMEVAEGGFLAVYCGATYATEVLSNGANLLMHDAYLFATEDAHHFDHVIGIMHNARGAYTHRDAKPRRSWFGIR